MPTRTLTRLELRCGHIAYALASEPSAEGQFRQCHACDRVVTIASATRWR